MQKNTNFLQKISQYLKYPLIQAPMAGGSITNEIITEVTKQGCLGSLATGLMKPEQVYNQVKQLNKLMNNVPYNINLFVPEFQNKANRQQIENVWKILKQYDNSLGDLEGRKIPLQYQTDFGEILDIVVKNKNKIVSFTFGCLEGSEIERLKRKNEAFIMGTATNLKEAIYLQDQGVDAIILQGSEAGGHRGSFLFNKGENQQNKPELIQLEDLVGEIIPIIASGGISNKNQIQNYMAQGVDGVSIGTMFLTTKESGIKAKNKNILLENKNIGTTISRCYSGKYARSLNSSFTKNMEKHLDELLPYNIQLKLTQYANTQSDREYGAIYAGSKYYDCQDITVKDLLQELLKGFE
ncbi:hypothetical protein PPERSA_03249 [Pseudocohnilembus persalinus]|uniref:Uncharacterized protein n=1 Tax=Pseudocohnilembus persalinus TaxID=266149 RepID=A0A0V0QZU5_PSEPJ|nr:hypothetical protein PPERSA_03249 [Pseudocohnilembus persalinus]|eukprot:KRX07416.1 hypothetical protein PPERSA_03249 [Pseudocohnilembus persalinus]